MCCELRNQFLDVSYTNFVIQKVKSPVLSGGEFGHYLKCRRSMQFKTRTDKCAVTGNVNYIFKVYYVLCYELHFVINSWLLLASFAYVTRRDAFLMLLFLS